MHGATSGSDTSRQAQFAPRSGSMADGVIGRSELGRWTDILERLITGALLQHDADLRRSRRRPRRERILGYVRAL